MQKMLRHAVARRGICRNPALDYVLRTMVGTFITAT